MGRGLENQDYKEDFHHCLSHPRVEKMGMVTAHAPDDCSREGAAPLSSGAQSTSKGDINTYTTSRYFLDHHLKGETKTECFVDAHCLRESRIEVYIGIKEISAHIFQSIFAVTNYIHMIVFSEPFQFT